MVRVLTVLDLQFNPQVLPHGVVHLKDSVHLSMGPCLMEITNSLQFYLKTSVEKVSWLGS